jgi:hypothetical protein
MQESLIAINDLKLEKENIYKKVEQLKLTIKSLENDKQSLKLQQVSGICVSVCCRVSYFLNML